MSYIITDRCVNCAACKSQCPVDAIFRGEKKFVINQKLCISCGACAGVCPVGAPIDENEQ
ncbi:MAG: 4Fe-4S binding protein [Oscillospiraceae bacterium]|jgi:ferredoxin|nr:4Fe-4S binding protein [Oscillospiraceae bacterium]